MSHIGSCGFETHPGHKPLWGLKPALTFVCHIGSCGFETHPGHLIDLRADSNVKKRRRNAEEDVGPGPGGWGRGEEPGPGPTTSGGQPWTPPLDTVVSMLNPPAECSDGVVAFRG